MTLEEKITELENEIRHCWRLHDATEDKEEKRELRRLIEKRADNLDKLLIQQREERHFQQSTQIQQTQQDVQSGDETLADKLDEIKALLQKAHHSKDGSKLSTECVNYFKSIKIEPAKIIPQPNLLFQLIKNEVMAHSTNMINLRRANQVDEVTYVQPNSFRFFQKICQIYLFEYQNEIELVNKTTNIGLTSYTTILACDNGEIFYVNGQTDSTLLYCGIPIATWEDKNLKLTLDSTTEIGQALVEVKANSEYFKGSIGLPPPRFTGILTNGLVWSLVIQSYSTESGKPLYTRTLPISIYSKDETSTIITIVEENVNTVTSLLIYHLQTIQSLIHFVDLHNQKINNTPNLTFPENQNDDQEDHDDDDEENNDDDKVQGKKSLKKAFQAISISSSGENKTSKNKDENKNQKSSGKKSGKNKRNSLQPLNSNSMLTHENMYQHNAMQLSF
eukprot:CAMPEP_0174825186 /NCGR_PEP_ID=MMETSP1107-20130205/42519_1 /TAXON_ID=36770 /ORGANISM="Paraphysomonas vestita, Strain GFlagA" /LENGTH=447 /DNA_ID=CAMNT_0016056567 /DNA_START=2100 /DNA_END=3443 /DNA_ORIENTATION=-